MGSGCGSVGRTITEAGNGPLKRTKDCFEPFVLDAFIKVGQSRMFVYFIFLLIS